MSYKNIPELLQYLPKKDIIIGSRLYQNKDWDSLKELIDSAIYKIKVDLRKENPKQESLEADMDGLNALSSEVNLHLMDLDPNACIEDSYLDELSKLELLEYGYRTIDDYE